MKTIIRFLQLTIIVVLISGCATSLVSDVDPQTDLSSLQSFYVVNQPADKRSIESMIASELNSMGKKDTAGSDPKPPEQVDAVVTYVDKWMWDITMYLIELRIDIRDPETNYKLATGHSYRTSLARKSPEEMVKEVLGEIFKGQSGEEK
jgi:hypothetical protein